MADEIVQALGRSCELGQLYSGLTDSFRNDYLFLKRDIDKATRILPVPQTELTYREVRTSKDRADLLNVQGKVQLSALGNTIGDVSFQAKYLRGEDFKERSEAISGLMNVRTLHERLHHQSLNHQQVYTAADLSRFGVSHVVTGITYGSRLLGTFYLSQREKKKWKELSGDGALKIVLASGFKFSGTAVGSSLNDEGSTGNEVAISFDADTVDDESETPTTGPALVARLQRGIKGLSTDFEVRPDGSHVLAGRPGVTLAGVPIEITLTPVQHFDGFSTVIAFRELAAAELAALTNFYDQVLDLHHSAGTTFGQMESSRLRLLCPSLVQQARSAVGMTERLLTDTQTALGSFLRSYRSDTSSQSANAFMQSRLPASAASQQANAAIDRAWTSFQILSNELTKLGKTLIGPNGIKERMREVAADSKRSLSLFLIPPNYRRVSLLNTLSLSAVDFITFVQQATGTGSSTTVHTIYADPLLASEILQLDPDPVGPINKGLKSAAVSPETLNLVYGRLAGPSGQLIWKLSGEKDWPGILRSTTDGSYYQGHMRDGLPHGDGRMDYCAADGGMAFHYEGSWHLGKRDGLGSLLEGTQLFIADKPVGRTLSSMRDGLAAHLVQVELYSYGKLRDARRVALYHPDGLDAKVKKIAEAFGWRRDAICRLTPPESGRIVTVEGTKIVEGLPEPSVPIGMWYKWPLASQQSSQIGPDGWTSVGVLRVDIIQSEEVGTD